MPEERTLENYLSAEASAADVGDVFIVSKTQLQHLNSRQKFNQLLPVVTHIASIVSQFGQDDFLYYKDMLKSLNEDICGKKTIFIVRRKNNLGKNNSKSFFKYPQEERNSFVCSLRLQINIDRVPLFDSSSTRAF